MRAITILGPMRDTWGGSGERGWAIGSGVSLRFGNQEAVWKSKLTRGNSGLAPERERIRKILDTFTVQHSTVQRPYTDLVIVLDIDRAYRSGGDAASLARQSYR